MFNLPLMAAGASDKAPLITNDAVVFGILMAVLGFVFYTHSQADGFWKKFYSIVPSILVCYFLPSVFGTLGIISGDESQLYFVASRYLLPACLVLLTLSVDLPGVFGLGPKALIMFFTGDGRHRHRWPAGDHDRLVVRSRDRGRRGPEAIWRGLTTVAGSWIGGGANQAAMKEVFGVGDQIFSALIAVDVIVANVWMGVLLFAAGRWEDLDRKRGVDSSAIVALRDKMAAYQLETQKIPKLPDTMMILAVGFVATGISHVVATNMSGWLDGIAGDDPTHMLRKMSLTSSFFWLIVTATTIGVLLSFTRARQLEGVGASRIGSVFIFILVATIGMKMDLMAIFRHPGLFLVGLIWIAFHAFLMILVAQLIRAPVFFLAVGSQANVGGAASAPVMAAAFHPGLASVGVLLAVLGYVLGTYGAWLCGQLMRIVAGGG